MKKGSIRPYWAIILAVLMVVSAVSMICSDEDLNAEIIDGDRISSNTTWDSKKTISNNLIIEKGVTLTVKAPIVISGNVTITGGGTISRETSQTGDIEAHGAIIEVGTGNTLTLENITIDGGSIWSEDGPLEGTESDEAAIRIDGGSVTLGSDAVIQNNNHTSIRDNPYYHSGWRFYNIGGGEAIYNGGTLTMNGGSIITQNAVSNFGHAKGEDYTYNEKTGAIGNSDSIGGGVGIYEDGTFIMNGGSITSNKAIDDNVGRAYGGGLGMISRGANTEGGTVDDTFKISFEMDSGDISGNYSTRNGGGIYGCIDQSEEEDKPKRYTHVSATINGTLSDNSSVGDGGGICANYMELIVTNNAKFLNNTANNGGGINITGTSKALIYGGLAEGNTATLAGGGLYISGTSITYTIPGETEPTSKYLVSGMVFKDNHAGTMGGGISILTSRSAILKECTIIGNTAEISGGGINTNRGVKLDLIDCIITGNDSATDGDGIYVNSDYNTDLAQLSISGTTIIYDNDDNSSNMYVCDVTPVIDVDGLREDSIIDVYWNKWRFTENNHMVIVNSNETTIKCLSTSNVDFFYTMDEAGNVSITKSPYILLHDGDDIISVGKINSKDGVVVLTDSFGASKEGYILAGWCSTDGDINTIQNEFKFKTDENIKVGDFYAYWIQKTIDISSEADLTTIGYSIKGSPSNLDQVTVNINGIVSVSQPINIESGYVTICGGGTLSASDGFKGTMVNTCGISVVTFENITIDANRTRVGDDGMLQYTNTTNVRPLAVRDTSTAILGENSRLTGGAEWGAGAYVCGTLVMDGGQIDLCYNDETISGIDNSFGGAVLVNDGKFIMYDGSIDHNVGRGAVCLLSEKSSFTMNGGSISDNISPKYAGGGIVSRTTSPGNLVINGGEITGNTAVVGGGIYAQHLSLGSKAIVINNRSSDGLSSNILVEGSGLSLTAKPSSEFNVGITLWNKGMPLMTLMYEGYNNDDISGKVSIDEKGKEINTQVIAAIPDDLDLTDGMVRISGIKEITFDYFPTTTTPNQKHVLIQSGKEYIIPEEDRDLYKNGNRILWGFGIGSEPNYDATYELGKTIKASSVVDCTVLRAIWLNDIETATVTIGEYTFTGEEQTISVIITYQDGEEEPRDLEVDVDYVIYGNKAINADNYTLSIEGIGEFAGTKKVECSIKPVDLKDCKIVVQDTEYTAQNALPVITITFNKTTLTSDDFTATCSNSAVGDASVTITGNRNFTGTDVKSFKITPKTVTVSGITVKDKTYDGSTDATVSTAGAQFDGIVDGDILSITATGTFSDANAGDEKKVNITLGTLAGDDAKNYTIAKDGTRPRPQHPSPRVRPHWHPRTDPSRSPRENRSTSP